MKKFFALVLALVMALSLATVAWGAESVATLDALQQAITGGETEITLTDPITINGDTTIESDAPVTITVDAALTATGKDAFEVQANGTLTLGANVTIVGEGAILWANSGNIVVDGAVVKGTNGANVAVAVYPNSTLTVKAGKITSADNAVWAKGGNVIITGSGVVETTATAPISGAYASNGGKITVENGGKVVGPLGASANGTVTVNDGGLVEGYVSAYFDGAVVNVTGGEVTGKVGIGEGHETSSAVVEISGGTFGADVSKYVVAGKQQLANGSVVTTPAAGAVAPTLYVWDTAAKDWATYYIATGDDLDDLKLGADDNCLPCYFIDGRYFVDTTEAAATYKLVYGATKLFLAPVDVTDVHYMDNATVYTNVTKEADECGKLLVTDTTKTYYVAYDENNNDEDYYFVATKNGPIQLLVGGKIVDVAPNGAQDLTAHVWEGYDVVNNAYTTAKCENCPKIVKLYATGTAAGKGAHYEPGLGYITKIDNGFGPTVTPSTDKVTSAETFDAGIAMYVGVSIMAAAGSAVVIGKKKD